MLGDFPKEQNLSQSICCLVNDANFTTSTEPFGDHRPRHRQNKVSKSGFLASANNCRFYQATFLTEMSKMEIMQCPSSKEFSFTQQRQRCKSTSSLAVSGYSAYQEKKLNEQKSKTLATIKDGHLLVGLVLEDTYYKLLHLSAADEYGISFNVN